jgi:hypothetical protein
MSPLPVSLIRLSELQVCCSSGPAVALPHNPQILSALPGLVEHEPTPRVIDQIVGAVSRYVVAVGLP